MIGTLLGLLLVVPAQRADQARELHLGAEQTSVLAAARGSDGTPTLDRYQISLRDRTVLTLKVRSLDFEPSLAVRASRGPEVEARAFSVLGDDAWWAQEIPEGSTLELEIGSADGRPGEYTLVAVEGAVSLPAGLELLNATRGECRSIAQHALERGDPTRACEFWIRSGTLGLQSDDFASAREELTRGRELAERTSSIDAALEARLQLALLETWHGDKDIALAAFVVLESDCSARARATAGTAEEVQAAFRLAQVCDSLGDLRSERVGKVAAVSDYRHAAEAVERARVPGAEVTSLMKLAFALEETGEPEEADSTLERGNAIAKACPPATNRNDALRSRFMRSEVLFTRARIETLRGLNDLALEHAHEALGLESRPAMRAGLIGTLARAYLDTAQYEEAAARLEELGTLIAEAGLTELEIPQHRTLGVLAWRLRDLTRAREELSLALDLAQAAGSIEAAAETRLDLALLLYELGEGPEAGKQLARVIDEARALHNPKLEGQAWLDSGALHDSSGELDAADAAYGQAARLARESNDSSLAAQAEGNLGFVAYLRGDRALARRLSVAAAERMEALGLREEAVETRDTLARLALAEGDRNALRSEIDSARRLLESLVQPTLEPLQRSWHRSRFAEWGALEQSLVSLCLAQKEPEGGRDPGVVQEGFAAVGAWKGRVLLDGLRGDHDSVTPALRANCANRSAWLPPRAALLDYFETIDHLGVYLVQGSGIVRIELEERAPITRDAARFVDLISDGRTDAGRLIAASAALWESVLAPALARLDPGIETLVVVPSAALAAVPFEALVSDRRQGSSAVCREPRCVIDDYLVCYVPSADVLPLLAEQGPRNSPGRHLILGDAIYGGEDTVAGAEAARRLPDKQLAGLRRLEMSRAEALGLANLLLLPGELPGGDVNLSFSVRERNNHLFESCFDLYLGAEASCALFDGDMRCFSEIHMAVHAFADYRDPRRSLLLLSGVGQRSGVLSLEKILHSRFDADLVVLSACSSGRGPMIRGEGVQSLAYAFMEAGARSIVATHWNVNDQEASEILFGFEVLRREPDRRHPEWEDAWRRPSALGHGLKPLHPAEALRAARQAFREHSSPRGHGVDSSPTWNPGRWASYLFIGAPPR